MPLSSSCVDNDTHEKVWGRPGNEATQTSHLDAHIHKNQKRLERKGLNLGASQKILCDSVSFIKWC